MKEPHDILPELTSAEYDQLRESIRRHGVLVSVVVTEDGSTIDGRARVNICAELGIKDYPRRIIGKLSDAERTEYRIRINAERRHLSAKQRRELLAKYILAAPTKSVREVADALKISKDTVSRTKRKLGVRTDTHGKDGRTYKHRPAVSVETRAGAKIVGKLLAGLDDTASGGMSTRKLRRTVFDQATSRYAAGKKLPLPDAARLLNTDFRSNGIDSNSVDLGLVDPPWGESHWGLLPDLGKEYMRILKPGAMLAAYCGVGQIPSMLDAFVAAGLVYHWQVVGLNPPGCAGHGHRGIRNAYRPILLFRKPGPVRGRANAERWLVDVLTSGKEELPHHRWQQPLHESASLVLGLSRPGDLVVDLTAGSGTSGVAAVSRRRRWIGTEIEKKTFRIALRRLGEAGSALTKTA